MQQLYKYWRDGDNLDQMIKDWIFNKRLSQSQVALLTGKSEATISRIMSSRYCFGVECLPAFIHQEGGVEILRHLCSMLDMIPVPLPKGGVKTGPAVRECAELQIALIDAAKDGRLTMREAQKIEKELMDVFAAVKEEAAKAVEA